jgi:very-short-patch-repair endonuclease
MRKRYETDIEKIMRFALEKTDLDFVQYFPIRGKYGYELDFAISQLKIDIECDGKHWHKKGNAHDRKRNWVLRNRGWIVIRFTCDEIKTEINKCIEKIFKIVERRLKEYEDKSSSERNCTIDYA